MCPSWPGGVACGWLRVTTIWLADASRTQSSAAELQRVRLHMCPCCDTAVSCSRLRFPTKRLSDGGGLRIPTTWLADGYRKEPMAAELRPLRPLGLQWYLGCVVEVSCGWVWSQTTRLWDGRGLRIPTTWLADVLRTSPTAAEPRLLRTSGLQLQPW